MKFPEKYLQKYITGKNIKTVLYYKKLNPDIIRRLKKIHKDQLNCLKKVNFKVINEIRPERIDAAEISNYDNLAFMNTYICTYGNECPAKLEKMSKEYRCNDCEYAVYISAMLSAISSEYASSKLKPKDIEKYIKKESNKKPKD